MALGWQPLRTARWRRQRASLTRGFHPRPRPLQADGEQHARSSMYGTPASAQRDVDRRNDAWGGAGRGARALHTGDSAAHSPARASSLPAPPPPLRPTRSAAWRAGNPVLRLAAHELLPCAPPPAQAGPSSGPASPPCTPPTAPPGLPEGVRRARLLFLLTTLLNPGRPFLMMGQARWRAGRG